MAVIPSPKQGGNGFLACWSKRTLLLLQEWCFDVLALFQAVGADTCCHSNVQCSSPAKPVHASLIPNLWTISVDVYGHCWPWNC